METTTQILPMPDPAARPAVDAAETQIQALVSLLPRLGRIFKSQLRGAQLSMPQMAMLMALREQTESRGGAHPGELADRFCLSSPAITAALDELVEKGYCVRTHSEKDRRKVLVRSTPEGEAMVAAAQATVTQGMREMLGGWDQERIGRLLTAMQDLDAAAESYLGRGRS
jgi:DNA-binding MarR family transcriptional regulator